MRRALWATAIYDLGGAFLFAFPGSPLGQLAGLPAEVPVSYRAILASFPVLFAGMYAWLALQPTIDRPLVAFSAIGKAAVFVLVFALCLAGATPFRALLAGSGDLVFAIIFANWLRSSAVR